MNTEKPICLICLVDAIHLARGIWAVRIITHVAIAIIHDVTVAALIYRVSWHVMERGGGLLLNGNECMHVRSGTRAVDDIGIILVAKWPVGIRRQIR